MHFRLDLYPKEHHCNASLRLNDTVAMSGGQIANITSLDYNATLYLGNAPRAPDSDSKPFIGCIKELEVNKCYYFYIYNNNAYSDHSIPK